METSIPANDTSVPRTSKTAIWSMVLGLAGLATVCLVIGLPLAVVGLILGIMATVQIGKPGKPAEGKPYAITGIITSALTLVAGPLMVIPLMIGILLPALGAARQTAQQMQSNTQARGIHMSMMMWSENQPANPQSGNTPMPDDLWMLVNQSYFTIEYLASPMMLTQIPPDYATWPEAQQREWIATNSSYVIVPGEENDFDSARISLFGKPDHHDGRGIPVAYNDGHTQWVAASDLHRIDAQVQAQTGKSMQQLIDESEVYP